MVAVAAHLQLHASPLGLLSAQPGPISARGPDKCGPMSLEKPTAVSLPESSFPLRLRPAMPSLQMLGAFSVLRSRALLPLAPPPRLLHRRRPQPRAVSSSSLSSTPLQPPPPEMEASYKFGPYKIDAREVFHATPLSYAMVNLRPLLPGHILLFQWNPFSVGSFAGIILSSALGLTPYHVTDPLAVPLQVCNLMASSGVKRFVDLSSDEISDLWITAKEVGARLEQYHKASSLTFAIQDGPQAGQTVPHVHIHVIPRTKGDFEKNDEIYDAIDVKEKELKEKLDLDIERKDRTMDEMAHEANEYRALFS
ncbi:hypothetical protein ACP70R_021838 [Stipagrostis hirtigluma subsp. patula]